MKCSKLFHLVLPKLHAIVEKLIESGENFNDFANLTWKNNCSNSFSNRGDGGCNNSCITAECDFIYVCAFVDSTCILHSIAFAFVVCIFLLHSH